VVTKWAPGGRTLRLHIGLENVDDLKADLNGSMRGIAEFLNIEIDEARLARYRTDG